MLTPKWQSELERSLSFYLNGALDSERGVVFSNVGPDGVPLDDEVHCVAFSRLVYGLALSGRNNPTHRDLSHRTFAAFKSELIAEDDTGIYFRPKVGGAEPEQDEVLDFWQQAYGLTGMVEMFGTTGDGEILTLVRKAHAAFVARFLDPDAGGFVNNFDRNTKGRSADRSFMSLVYPLTAYLLNLWTYDVENRADYAAILQKSAEILTGKQVWNEDLGWINVNFDSTWTPTPDLREVYPGHCFQMAWFLQRVVDMNIVEGGLADKCATQAQLAVASAVKKPVWAANDAGGFYEAVNPETNKALNRNRSWWQQCEAVIGLHLVPGAPQGLGAKLLGYFNAHFVDRDQGGEFAGLDEDDNPMPGASKGDKGKSVYHVGEMYRLLSEAGVT